MKTLLTERVGIQHPIIQAPLAGGGDTPALVAAVCEAGALHPVDGGGDDVVEIPLAAQVPLHRIEAQLHGRHVVLAVGAAQDLVHGALHGERR